MFNTPSFNDTLESFTLSDTDDVHHFVVVENGVNFDFFLEITISEIDLLGSGTTINLDFENVVLLLSQLREGLHLSGTDSSNNSAVFFYSVQLDINRFFLFFVFLRIFRESFLFRDHPILIESSQSILVQFLGPYGSQSS
jgi:hypothetical protein